MKIGRVLIVALVSTATLLHAATPVRGSNRLRELVVWPEVLRSTFNFGISCRGGVAIVTGSTSPADEITDLREQLKKQPDNGIKLLHLGYRLDDTGETNEATACYKKAEKVFRDKVEGAPQDGLALTDLGAALLALHKEDEAESVFRKSVLVSSNDWRCWARLGNFLDSESLSLLFPPNSSAPVNFLIPPHEIFGALSFPRPSAEALEKSEALFKESSKCFDRGMALSASNSEAYFQRAGFCFISNWLSHTFQYLHGNETLDRSEWMRAFFPKETIINLQRAAELDPKDYQDICLAAYFTILPRAMLAGSADFTPAMLPDSDQQLVRSAMKRLEDLSQKSDQKIAAAAFENLGLLHMMLKNNSDAVNDLKHAVALDPTRETSWDLLLVTTLSLSGSTPEDLVAICKARLKQKNSARNHLLLAKALTKQEKWEMAAKEAETAATMDTNNIAVPLLLAAIAIKHSDKADYITLADTNMERANFLLSKIPSSDERHSRWREFELNGAILNALEGRTEIAKAWASEVLKYFPNDETAREILKAID